MIAREVAELLGINLDFDNMAHKSEPEMMHQLKRRVRYFCFSMKRKADGEGDKVRVPKKFMEYFENMNSFEGWPAFGVTWDIDAKAPHIAYPRDFSLHEEWEATIRRVVPELPVDRVWRQGDGRKGNV